jgi:ABC-type glycerol-3-phosphate transport system permease component
MDYCELRVPLIRSFLTLARTRCSIISSPLPQFFPYVLILIPFYVLMTNLGLVDTHGGLILTHTSITLPFGLWMLTGYFNAIPRELDQAASIDGCSRLGVLFRIIYPIAVPGLIVAIVPTIVFFSIVQRRLVAGLTAGAVK